MPNFTVRVTYEWPVDAVNPADAMSTVQLVTRSRFTQAVVTGKAEVIEPDTGRVQLTAQLVTRARQPHIG